MERLDSDKERYQKLLITGRSGTGKSSLAATAPKPLVLLSERQGAQSIINAAVRLNRPQPEILFMEKISDYKEVIDALKASGESGDIILKTCTIPRPETIIVDSLSDLSTMMADFLMPEGRKPSGDDWGKLKKSFTNLVNRFRNLPFHVIFLALLDERTETVDGEEVVTRKPLMATRSHPVVASAACNAAGISSRKRVKAEDGSISYKFQVYFMAGDADPAKPHDALDYVEEADIELWLRKLDKYRETKNNHKEGK